MGVVLAVIAVLASAPAVRADEHLAAAEAALARGDAAASAHALALASIYIDSHLWLSLIHI